MSSQPGLEFFRKNLYTNHTIVLLPMLNPKQREVLSEKMADLGNLAAASLIFGTIIREEILPIYSLLLGLALVFVSYLISILLTRNLS